ncbi:MAG: hypothetical protein ACI9AR_000403 [Flavobacteriaceae bacterium]|jgi:hypothetical protein
MRNNKQNGFALTVAIIIGIIVAGGVVTGVTISNQKKDNAELLLDSSIRLDAERDTNIADVEVDTNIADVSVDETGSDTSTSDNSNQSQPENDIQQSVDIYLTGVYAHGNMSQGTSCLESGKLIKHNAPIIKGDTPLRDTLELMFNFDPQKNGLDEQVSNFTYNKGLSIENILIENRNAYISLNDAAPEYTNECHKVWVKEVITLTATQFSTVDSATIYINGMETSMQNDSNISKDVYNDRSAYLIKLENQSGNETAQVDIITTTRTNDPSDGTTVTNTNPKLRTYKISSDVEVLDARQGSLKNSDTGILPDVLYSQGPGQPYSKYNYIQIWTNQSGFITKILIPYTG